MDQEKIGARCNEIGHDALPLRRLAGQGIVAGQTGTLEVARSGLGNVRFGSKADIGAPPSNVRFTPKSGH